MSETAGGGRALPTGFNWRCAFGLHRWLMWSAPKQEEAIVTYNAAIASLSTTQEITLVRQGRMCAECGVAQVREVRYE